MCDRAYTRVPFAFVVVWYRPGQDMTSSVMVAATYFAACPPLRLLGFSMRSCFFCCSISLWVENDKNIKPMWPMEKTNRIWMQCVVVFFSFAFVFIFCICFASCEYLISRIENFVRYKFNSFRWFLLEFMIECFGHFYGGAKTFFGLSLKKLNRQQTGNGPTAANRIWLKLIVH